MTKNILRRSRGFLSTLKRWLGDTPSVRGAAREPPNMPQVMSCSTVIRPNVRTIAPRCPALREGALRALAFLSNAGGTRPPLPTSGRISHIQFEPKDCWRSLNFLNPTIYQSHRGTPPYSPLFSSLPPNSFSRTCPVLPRGFPSLRAQSRDPLLSLTLCLTCHLVPF